MNKTNKILSNMVKYNIEDDDSFEVSALNINPGVRWAKFILTDDEPNGNNIRIPMSEFSNIIKTGVYMPLKVAEGEISEGHKGTKPIGVITHLKQVKNRIEGLAMLWSKERPEDVEMLKEKYDSGDPLDLSWEIEYSDSIVDETTETKDLIGTRLRAVTLVGIPAYKGRTPITAFASEEKQEELKLEELKQIKDKLAVAEQENTNLKNEILSLQEKITGFEQELSGVKEMKDELKELREFKKEIDELKERAEKIEKIKIKFSDAGLEKSDEYFEKNIDKFLEMSEENLEFLLQEMVSFSSETKEPEESHSSMPNVTGTIENLKIKDLVKYLREQNKK